MFNIYYFILIFLQQKCNVNEENKDFSVDGSEYNALNDFLIFT